MTDWINSPPQINDGVVITDSNYDSPDSPYSGIPGRFVAMSWPFVMLRYLDNSTIQYDLRRVTIAKCTPEYINRFENLHRPRVQQAMARQNGQPAPTVPSPESDGNIEFRFTCPRCSGPMVETLVAAGDWEIICQECGLKCKDEE